MDPTCRTCCGYPCTCGQAIGVPILMGDKLMIRDGLGTDLSLRPYEEPKPKTEEEIRREREEQKRRAKEREEENKRKFESGTCNQEIANDMLYKAIKNKDTNLAQEALSKGACPTLRISINRVSTDLHWNGDTILHLAISNNCEEIVQSLVNHNVDVNTIGNKNMYSASAFTPLLLAIRSGNARIVQILLEAGANMSITDSVGRDALQMPCDNARIKQLLNQFKNTNSKGKNDDF